MPLTTQKAVMVNLDKLAAGHMRKAAADYRRQIVGRMVEALQGSPSAKGALETLDAGLLKRMVSMALETAISDDYVQAGLIGRASALPKSEVRNGK